MGQERDVVKVLRVAEVGNKRDKRVAAFELATLAAFSEDNKYLIGKVIQPRSRRPIATPCVSNVCVIERPTDQPTDRSTDGQN